MSLTLFMLCVTSIIGSTYLNIAEADCIFNAKNLPKTHKAPMVLQPTSTANVYSFKQPDAEGDIKLKHNEKIVFACAGNGNSISTRDDPMIETSCDTNNKIKDVEDVKHLGCARDMIARTIQTRTTCGNGGTVVNVELEVSSNQPQKRGFVTIYTLCFEGNMKIPSYARHSIQGVVNCMRYGIRPVFRSGGIVPDLHDNYKQSSVYLEKNLRISNYTRNNNLMKVHLVPRADYPYASQQDSTFFYENTAPQWLSVNKGNWIRLEGAIQLLALTKRNLQIVTGTWGVARLQDINHTFVSLYLNGDNRVQVPALFWKVVYDPPTKKAVAIFSSNNPYNSLQALSVPAPCPNSVCKRLTSWLEMNPSDIMMGEVVCCEIKDVNPTLNLKGIPSANIVTGLLV